MQRSIMLCAQQYLQPLATAGANFSFPHINMVVLSVENCFAGGDSLQISAASIHRQRLKSLDYHLGENHITVGLFV